MGVADVHAYHQEAQLFVILEIFARKARLLLNCCVHVASLKLQSDVCSRRVAKNGPLSMEQPSKVRQYLTGLIFTGSVVCGYLRGHLAAPGQIYARSCTLKSTFDDVEVFENV